MNSPESIDQQIDTLLNRAVSEIFPSKDFLGSLLKTKRLKIYTGIDPTGPTLHIGHAIFLKKLQQFQKLGHEVILLIGDFTAMIGDPTDKMATRKPLTAKEIKLNMKKYKKQASTFLNFSGKNKAVIKYNSKWLKKLKFENVLNLSSLITVDQMLKRDMFVRRMEEGKPISLNEFMYPLMQGYDSVVMEVDVEIGGNDQMFNMLMGRDLLKKIKNKEKIAITTKLLTDSSGKKMGKTEGNMITLEDSPRDMCGKVMSWSDGMIVPGFELCTNAPNFKIEEYKQELENKEINPRDIKLELAKEIIAIYYGENKAKETVNDFINTFSEKKLPSEIEEIKVQENISLGSVLIANNILQSMSEYKRLVLEKAITAFEINGDEKEKVDEFNFILKETLIYKIGKKKFVKIIVNK